MANVNQDFSLQRTIINSFFDEWVYVDSGVSLANYYMEDVAKPFYEARNWLKILEMICSAKQKNSRMHPIYGRDFLAVWQIKVAP